MPTYSANETPVTLDALTTSFSYLTFSVGNHGSQQVYEAGGGGVILHVDGEILDSNAKSRPFAPSGYTYLPSVLLLICTQGGSQVQGQAEFHFPFQNPYPSSSPPFPMAFSLDVSFFDGNFFLNNTLCANFKIFIQCERPGLTVPWGGHNFDGSQVNFHIKVDTVTIKAILANSPCGSHNPGGDGKDGNLCIGACLTVAAHSADISGTTNNWSVVADSGTLATNGTPNGWSVSYSAPNLTICAPCGVAEGNVVVTYQVNSTTQAWVSIKLKNCGNCPGAATGGVSNLHRPRVGTYGRFSRSSSGILFHRCITPVPGSLESFQVTSTSGDLSPHGCYDERTGRLMAVYTTGGVPGAKMSGDDGEHWISATDPPGVTFPRIVVDPYTGDTLRAGYDSGHIKTTFQAMGETSASSAVTITDDASASLSVENDSFDMVRLTDGRWGGLFRVSGSGVCSLWKSADVKGTIWKKAYDCLTGCSKPRMAVDYLTGDLLLVGYISGKLKGQFQTFGELTPSALFTLKDNTGTDLAPQNDVFDISKAVVDNASRWVLTGMFGADVVPSEWTSGSVSGAAFKKV